MAFYVAAAIGSAVLHGNIDRKLIDIDGFRYATAEFFRDYRKDTGTCTEIQD